MIEAEETYFNELETDFNFDSDLFEFEAEPESKSRYIKPQMTKQLPVMMANISNQIYLQWLSKLQN